MNQEDIVLPSGCVIHYSLPRVIVGGDHSVWITCPVCKKRRLASSSNLQRLRLGKLTGRCSKCSAKVCVGSAHGHWRGGRTISNKSDIDGYVHTHIALFTPEEQVILEPMRPKNKPYILQHRAVMALHLGRPLGSWEIIHHKNGIRDDNRLENLIITDAHTHVAENTRMVQKYRIEIHRLQILLDKHNISY